MIQPPPTSTLFPYTTLFRSTGGIQDVQPVLVRPGMDRNVTILHRVHPIRCHRAARVVAAARRHLAAAPVDRKSTRLNSSHVRISYAVFCLKKKKNTMYHNTT